MPVPAATRKNTGSFSQPPMGINYAIDAEARLVRLDYVGATTADEFAATLTAIFRSTSYRPGFGFLSDRRNVEPPTKAYIEHALSFMEAHREQVAGGRWAVVVSTPASYGMGRMGQNIAEGRRSPTPVQVFRGIDEAEAWLNATAPKA